VTISDDEPAPSTYPVTYNANAATSGTIPSAQTKNHDVSLTLQNNTGILARTDNNFVGWNTQPDGLGTDYAVASNYTVNAAVILFAKWTSIFNMAPTITNIADSSTNKDTATSAIAFTVGDAETAATSLMLSGTSSNLTLVPNANIVFGGSGASRTVTVTPAANQTGTSTITVTVSDSALTATDTFVLTVNTVNTVTFNANGGDAPSPATILVTPGSAYGTLASATRSGYSLNGWFTAASGGTQVTSVTTVTIMGNHTLYAQWTQNLPEMDVTRSGTPISSGSYDALSGTSAGTGVPLTYLITNSGTGILTLGSPAVSGQSNCSVVINTQPANTVTASSSTDPVITVTPSAAGVWSANLSIANNDANENPYNWTISGNAITKLSEWKQSSFGVDWNNPAVAGDSVDYDKDGTANLIEYALGTSPTASNPSSQGAQSSTSGGKLNLTFNRVVANTDITIIVQAADDLSGTWTNIASSINGGATTSLIAGVTVSETGSGSTRSVAVTDLYTTNDPAHPRRFIRISVGP